MRSWAIPSGFAAYVGEVLSPPKGKGVQNWLDDIIINTKHVERHMGLVEKMLARLQQFGLSVRPAKSIWGIPQQAFVGMVISRLGVQPSQAKIEAVAKLPRANTVEKVRSLLGMGSYLRKFVPGYSSTVAPISDLLRDKRFASKKSEEALGAVGCGAGQGSGGIDRAPHIAIGSDVVWSRTRLWRH